MQPLEMIEPRTGNVREKESRALSRRCDVKRQFFRKIQATEEDSRKQLQ